MWDETDVELYNVYTLKQLELYRYILCLGAKNFFLLQTIYSVLNIIIQYLYEKAKSKKKCTANLYWFF